MNSPYRTESRSFGPTLESERLPVLGQDRHAGRARAWQRLLTGLGMFWGAIGLALLIAYLF